MDVQKIAARFRLNGWAELVKERVASGQSVKTFCAENGISESTYYVRQRKVRIAACLAQAESGHFSEQQVTQAAPPGWAVAENEANQSEFGNTLTIEVCGCKIEVTQNTDAELLEKTCRVLRTLC